MEPFRLTVAEAAARVRSRELSPVALTESLLDRIEALEPTLKAWVTVDRQGALEAARRCERELEQRGSRGPLHGVPVGLKDIFYTAGMKTTACSKVYADFVPPYDATAVARLREAGAIILGKTVTTEFAFADPPLTRNPWNPDCTPGGSSSGSAVAVAARMCPATLGSQTGGSTLRPAAYNGIVGFKPTYGRVSRYGVIPLSWSQDTVGILVRTVEDAALLLQVLAGHDPHDPSSANRPVPDYRQAPERPPAPPRIGMVRQFFFERADREVCQHTAAIAERLSRAGARVEEVGLPESFATAHAAQAIIRTVEAVAFHEELFREHREEYSPKLRALLEGGMLVPGVRYVQAQRLRRRFRRDMETVMGQVDALLTPAAPSPAPQDLSTTGDPVFQGAWTYAGLPAIAIPSGLSPSGMPLGIQLVGAPFAEDRLLAVARWCELVLEMELMPPNIP